MLVFTHHARRRMAQRAIAEQEVEEALQAVEVSYAAGEVGKTAVLGSTTGGRRLKVVVVADDDDGVTVVVTVADRGDEG